MCSYCGCESIEIVGRFMREHVELINASGDLRQACLRDDHAAVRDNVTRLAGLLAPHTAAEEAGIFAVLAEDPEFTGYVTQLCAEHEELDARLAAVGDAVDSAVRSAAYDAFESLLRHHIDREDNALFPAAAIAFAGPEWDVVTSLTPAP